MDLLARTSFDFKTGDDVQILSDKAYRRTSKSEYNAVGNVLLSMELVDALWREGFA